MTCARVLTFAVAVVLSACTLEPHYARPSAPVQATWNGNAAGKADAASVADIGWRQFFPDPVLQRLIELALTNNRDLRVAVLNVQAAQAQYRIQRADLFPSISATGLEQIERYPAGVSASSSTGGSSGAAANCNGVIAW